MHNIMSSSSFFFSLPEVIVIEIVSLWVVDANKTAEQGFASMSMRTLFNFDTAYCNQSDRDNLFNMYGDFCFVLNVGAIPRDALLWICKKGIRMKELRLDHCFPNTLTFDTRENQRMMESVRTSSLEAIHLVLPRRLNKKEFHEDFATMVRSCLCEEGSSTLLCGTQRLPKHTNLMTIFIKLANTTMFSVLLPLLNGNALSGLKTLKLESSAGDTVHPDWSDSIQSLQAIKTLTNLSLRLRLNNMETIVSCLVPNNSQLNNVENSCINDILIWTQYLRDSTCGNCILRLRLEILDNSLNTKHVAEILNICPNATDVKFLTPNPLPNQDEKSRLRTLHLNRWRTPHTLRYTTSGLLGEAANNLKQFKDSVIALLTAARDVENILIDVSDAPWLIFGSTVFSHMAELNPRLSGLTLWGHLRNNVIGSDDYNSWDGDDKHLVNTRGSLTALFVNCKELEKLYFNGDELFLDSREADAEML